MQTDPVVGHSREKLASLSLSYLSLYCEVLRKECLAAVNNAAISHEISSANLLSAVNCGLCLSTVLLLLLIDKGVNFCWVR